MVGETLIGHEATVAASSGDTWSTLVAFERYPAWTEAATLRGGRQVGDLLVYGIHVRTYWGRLRPLRFDGEVVECTPRRRLAWRGGARGVVLMDWAFELTPEGKATRVRHTLRLTGVLAWLFRWRMRHLLQPRMELLLSHLKKRLEPLPVTPAKHPSGLPPRSGPRHRKRSR